jgi:hypothetical protein
LATPLVKLAFVLEQIFIVKEFVEMESRHPMNNGKLASSNI